MTSNVKLASALEVANEEKKQLNEEKKQLKDENDQLKALLSPQRVQAPLVTPAREAPAAPQHQAAPRQAAPRQAAPRQAAPQRQAAPRQAAPRQAAPRQAAPRQAAPLVVGDKVTIKESYKKQEVAGKNGKVNYVATRGKITVSFDDGTQSVTLSSTMVDKGWH